MSEELIRKNLTKHGVKMGLYEFYSIGDTNLKTLKKYEIIPNKDYGKYELKKPDALLVDRRDKTNIHVIIVIEYKTPSEFNTIQKKEKAIHQCYEFYCKPLESKIGIITDKDEWFWINPQLKTDQGWEYILNEDNYSIQIPFTFENKADENEILKLIVKILDSINDTNSILIKEETQNPSNLADRVWQSIWLASGENPDVCLATFVEVFIFKYLSDLEILTINEDGARIDFNEVLHKDSNSLKYYFKYVRPHIKKLFPPNEDDNTSIINGIVLKPEIEEHNIIFHSILNEFEKFGTLKNIDPAFKSRLYERFLKKSISQKNWGQYFTPRNIIKAIIQMSDIEKLPKKSKIYDPACGVGGFVLEPILSKRRGDYYIDKNGNLKSKLNYIGHDRDPKTIILAKSNMLIFISELLRENPAITTQFAGLFNTAFHSLHKSVLGSLNSTNREYYDLIMTNPPYVTSGSSTQKAVIKENGRLKNFYKINAIGVEGLFVEKIINELKQNRDAFVIIPDGILNRINDKKLRQFIKDSCIINAIISLPINTFYTSSKKTYILALKKKSDSIPQLEPVFTYLITNVGETLDAKRFECENDLPAMVKLFKYFLIDKNNFETDDPKCKIQPVSKFDPDEHWSIDRWWSREEQIKLGIMEEDVVLSLKEFQDKFNETVEELKELNREISELK